MVLIAYYMLHVILHKMHAKLNLVHEGYSHNEHGIYWLLLTIVILG